MDLRVDEHQRLPDRRGPGRQVARSASEAFWRVPAKREEPKPEGRMALRALGVEPLSSVHESSVFRLGSRKSVVAQFEHQLLFG